MAKIYMIIDNKAFDLIEKARKEEFSTRTNFLVRSAVMRAREILNERG
jgi:uncharacterized protein (DUF1778 family)